MCVGLGKEMGGGGVTGAGRKQGQPRQRITVHREISRLRSLDNRTAEEQARCV